ncbi:MAG: bifunctional aldolase/short-chain dehydrogenase [Chloroflexi bacterium]|nr:bifunctional aldolase/short-chain dehydrogenase [Chloroflexota bacterium]
MRNQWNDADLARLPDFDGLLYASRLTGADTDLVVWGGGNTSVKRTETDFRGRAVRVLRVKGSGSDLKSLQVRDFPGVRLDDVMPLRDRPTMDDAEMVAYLGHSLMEPGSARPSIETLLHAFLPATFIIHTHADAILALTNTPHGERWVHEALGPGFVWVPYVRPGFGLSHLVASAVEAHPGAAGVVLEKHGLVTWGETARDAYDATISACTAAEAFVDARRTVPVGTLPRPRPVVGNTAASPAGGSSAGNQTESVATAPVLDASARRRIFSILAPLIRQLHARTQADGSLSPEVTGIATIAGTRTILHLDDADDVRAFASHPDAARLSRIGPATPDHLITTMRSPLYVPVPVRVRGASVTNPEDIATALADALPMAWEAWARGYVDYVDTGSKSDSGTPRPASVDARPRVILLPGVGMVTLGRDARATRIVADVYRHAMRVVRDAEALEAFTSLDAHDCYGVEFWPLELYKLTLAPPEASLARRVAFVTGAASGIGRAIAERLAAEGAHVVVADVDLDGARVVADAITGRFGLARALAVACDVTKEAGVARAVAATIEAYGGIDILVSNAGVAPSSPVTSMPLEMWQRSFDINATGHFLVTRECLRVMEAQGTGGSIIFITTKNTMAPGKDFAAYSAAKAAQAQLARVVAMEAGTHGIRVNMINPDAVFRNSTLWAPEVRRARAQAHGIDETNLEDFYRKRNLLRVTIDPDDVAEATWWLASDRSLKSTGTVITVDGGVPAAFPR